MSKYEPLAQFLSSRDDSALPMTFPQIEDILGFKLPISAYEYEAWWSNNATGHSHARVWLAAGWRAEDLNLSGHQVTFKRMDARPLRAPTTRRKRDPWGCMADTIKIMPGTDLTAPSGEQWNAEKGLLLNDRSPP